MDAEKTHSAKGYAAVYRDDETSSSSDDEDFKTLSLSRSSESSTTSVEEPDNTGRSKSQSPTSRSRSSAPAVGSRKDDASSLLSATSPKTISKRPQAPGQHNVRYETTTEIRRALIQARNALLDAAAQGKFKEAAELIASGTDLAWPDIDGMTALHHAAQNGHLYLVDLLVRSGASLQASTPDGYTPLALAVAHGNGAVVEYLIPLHYSSEAQADKNSEAPNKAGTGTAIVSRRSHNPSAQRPDLTAYELAAHAYMQEKERDKVDLLVDAVDKRNLSVVARMLAVQARKFASGAIIPKCSHVEETDEKGRSLLTIACGKGHNEIALLLLCAGASVDCQDMSGNTPLMHAVAARKPQTVALLLKAGASSDKTNNVGASALTMAIDQTDLAILQALMHGRVDIWNATAWGEPLIIYAAKSQKTDIVVELLKRNADIADRSGSRALARLARDGEPKAVRILLNAGADPHHKAADGHTAFTLAAANGRDTVLSMLFKHHPTPEWKKALQAEADNDGRTALMLATLNRKEDTVSFLLQNHAYPHQRDLSGRNTLLWAAAKADRRIVRILINHHATHVCADKAGNTIFIIAADHDNREVLGEICTPFYKNSQFDINTPNKDGDTALIKAARRGFLDTALLLLDQGANLLHTNQEGRTAILEAGAAGHTAVAVALQQRLQAMPQVFPYADEVLKLLASMPLISDLLPDRVPVRASEIDGGGNSIMMLAAGNGHDQLLHDLFAPVADDDKGQDYDEADESESCSVSLEPGNRVTRLASPSRMNIEATNLDGMTALGLATREGHYAAIKLLIENGAKVNGTMCSYYTGEDPVLITPLWLAAKLTECRPGNGTGNRPNQISYSPEMVVDLLLKNGAQPDINTPSWHDQPPLVAAAGAGRVAVVRMLIDHGAKLEAPDLDKLTPLMHAAYNGHHDVVKLLLDRGALPEPGPNSLTALILSAERGHDDVVSLLLDRGANINRADEFGDTPLIGAAKNGQISTVALLISRGANLNQTDERNKNALKHAAQRGHKEIVSLLAAGAPRPRDH